MAGTRERAGEVGGGAHRRHSHDVAFCEGGLGLSKPVRSGGVEAVDDQESEERLFIAWLVRRWPEKVSSAPGWERKRSSPLRMVSFRGGRSFIRRFVTEHEA